MMKRLLMLVALAALSLGCAPAKKERVVIPTPKTDSEEVKSAKGDGERLGSGLNRLEGRAGRGNPR